MDGEEIMQDVIDGIRRNVSVGYMVHAMQLESSDETGDTYRITDWEPIEISLASVPADTTVGIGRSLNPAQESPMDKDETDTIPGDTDAPETTTETTETFSRLGWIELLDEEEAEFTPAS